VIASERRQGDKPPQIFLRADKALDYGRVMEVMGELNRAGLNRVALVSNAKERR
jgi:biopolymer transport protein TolR